MNLDEKSTDRMEAIRKFTLMDDTFMTQVFADDLESTQELLKTLLNRDDLTVTRAAEQRNVRCKAHFIGRSLYRTAGDVYHFYYGA